MFGMEAAAMPWKIVRSQYDALDPATLHDDELIAMEWALRLAAAQPANETNPAWRAWQKVHPLAAACTGDGDPIEVLPPAARASPVWADYQGDGAGPAGPAQPPRIIPPVKGL
jgi:hypothetical protein